MSVARSTTRRLAVVAVVGVLGVMAGAQLVLPGVAANRVRAQIGRYGVVARVHVAAVPAITLLWGSAQSASVTAGRLDVSFAQAAGLLSSAAGFDRLDMKVGKLTLGPLAMTQATFAKRGNTAVIQGRVAWADLQSLVPAGFEAQLVGNSERAVLIWLRGHLFRAAVSVPAAIAPREGRLVVESGAFGSSTVTLFSDPRIRIDRLAMHIVHARMYQLQMSVSLA